MAERIIFHILDIAKSNKLNEPISTTHEVNGNSYTISADSIYYWRGYRRISFEDPDLSIIAFTFDGNSVVGTYGKLLVIQVENFNSNKYFYVYNGSGISSSYLKVEKPLVLKNSEGSELEETENSPSRIVLIKPDYRGTINLSVNYLLDTTNFPYAVKRNVNGPKEYWNYGGTANDVEALFLFLRELFGKVDIDNNNSWKSPQNSFLLRIPIEIYFEVMRYNYMGVTSDWHSDVSANKIQAPFDDLDGILESFGDSLLENVSPFFVSSFIDLIDTVTGPKIPVLLTDYPAVGLSFSRFRLKTDTVTYKEEVIRNSEDLESSVFSSNDLCKKVVEHALLNGVSEVVAYLVVTGRDDSTGSPVDWSEVENLISSKILVPIDGSDEGPLAKADVDFIVGLLPIGYKYMYNTQNYRIFGETLLPMIDSHLSVLSNKSPDFESSNPVERIGQKERYFVVSVPPEKVEVEEDYAIYLSEYVASKFATTLGKRTLMFTGNFKDVSISYLISSSNPTGRWNVFSNPDVNRFITWQLVGLEGLLTYLSLGDPTLPLTQKVVPNINFSGKKIGTYAFSDLVRSGAIVLYSDNANEGSATCYRSILSSYYWYNKGELMSYPEDIELSILFVEDLMDKENRDFLRRFRGQKVDSSTIAMITEFFKKYVLDNYVARGWIEGYRNYWIKQDPNYPDRLIGYYEYRPIYPINKIWVEHFFVV